MKVKIVEKLMRFCHESSANLLCLSIHFNVEMNYSWAWNVVRFVMSSRWIMNDNVGGKSGKDSIIKVCGSRFFGIFFSWYSWSSILLGEWDLNSWCWWKMRKRDEKDRLSQDSKFSTISSKNISKSITWAFNIVYFYPPW